jgi:hypothetical protein
LTNKMTLSVIATCRSCICAYASVSS